MVPSHGYTGYGAFTWVHWLWCLHMGTLVKVHMGTLATFTCTLAMVPSHGYTGYGAMVHMGT